MSELSRDLSELAGTWSYVYTQLTLLPSQQAQMFAANPLRWAFLAAQDIGFGNLGGNLGFWPASASVNALGFVTAQTGVFTLNYRQVGGLVGLAWNCSNTDPTNSRTVDVIEVLAQQ